MSRIGLEPVHLPEGVSASLSGNRFTAKGKLGELSLMFHEEVEPSLDGNILTLKPLTNSVRSKTLWGTYRALAYNVVQGVHIGFSRTLDINGVGYRAAVQGNHLILQLGFSHEIKYEIPSDVKISCPSQTEIVVTAVDKQVVGSVAAKIRAFRPPEPYKGKGVKYRDELIVRKEGKKK